MTIEQAKGLLAHAGNLEMGQAFEQLRDHARRHSTRLSDIAHHLVAGDLHPTEILTPNASRNARRAGN